MDRADTAGKVQTLLVSSRNSSRVMVARRFSGFRRENPALEKIKMYSCTSRSVGLAGDRQLPQAVEGEELAPLCQMISPRMRKPIFAISWTM
jgi:hypothetical protein